MASSCLCLAPPEACTVDRLASFSSPFDKLQRSEVSPRLPTLSPHPGVPGESSPLSSASCGLCVLGSPPSSFPSPIAQDFLLPRARDDTMPLAPWSIHELELAFSPPSPSRGVPGSWEGANISSTGLCMSNDACF
eukprot:CAMPEP_0114137896 /NCGR_PEP_ID=MMETSP0043_2-20121206/16018_1 /TAXON_ID=464988 /ORGANISM="Hemiselmis andersenii, Strain CCMP644" /LENGTH=134 /DNA_ID=CAMNT_0001231799 /DNA_START=44 /DNA_END=448 /DNA_ORIENTATION=-